VLCASIALPASCVAKGSSSKGCAVEVHTPACVLHHNVAVVARTAAAASKQWLTARIACMHTFPVACHAYLCVTTTRLTDVPSESAALYTVSSVQILLVNAPRRRRDHGCGRTLFRGQLLEYVSQSRSSFS
jgi:hypothetical protein